MVEPGVQWIPVPPEVRYISVIEAEVQYKHVLEAGVGYVPVLEAGVQYIHAANWCTVHACSSLKYGPGKGR